MESAQPNPLREGLEQARAGEPSAIVIFGASGDLTQRKLVPALYNLQLDQLLPAGSSIVGVARRPMSNADFTAVAEKGIEEHSRRPLDREVWSSLVETLSYVSAELEDPAGFRALKEHLERLDRQQGRAGNRLFYLATPPSAFAGIIRGLGEAGLGRPAADGSFSRVVIEKPFGHDLPSARALNAAVNEVFPESSVYRIDHYLGKETVQNLIVFRFANSILEPLWNQKYVDHVQLTVAEAIGVEGRGAYYEEAGTTRDMVQNHMFQLLCLTAMEPPASLDPNAIRDEKVKVLKSLRPVLADAIAEEVARGQYVEGVFGGKKVPGYLAEPGVAKDSRTETYVAMRIHIDNWRWAGVPFYLRAGKRLPKRVTEVTLQFRDVPHRLFRTGPDGKLAPNTLTLRIQPDEGITLRFESKVPGASTRIRPVAMDFRYGTSFGTEPPEAYERLILDAILGDSTLFIRRDEVEAAWDFVDRFEEAWSRERSGTPLPAYRAGTWGPAEADALIARDGRAWRRP